MGVQVVPALMVFQTPPESAATYQMPGAVGWTAMSAMRPLIRPGPMPRKGNAATALASGDSGGLADLEPAAWAARGAARTVAMATARKSLRILSSPMIGAPRVAAALQGQAAIQQSCATPGEGHAVFWWRARSDF